MRAECYVLHVYCDNGKDCVAFGFEESEEYTGANQREARSKARAAGWKIGKRDICPECQRAMTKEAKDNEPD